MLKGTRLSDREVISHLPALNLQGGKRFEGFLGITGLKPRLFFGFKMKERGFDKGGEKGKAKELKIVLMTFLCVFKFVLMFFY